MSIKTIFLDRDGVINKEVNYLYQIENFDFIDGVFETCKYFEDIGYKIVIITNQSGISRGYFSEQDFLDLTEWMINQFNNNQINILDVLYCPHSPEMGCDCRKPKPGMFFNAQRKHSIDIRQSWAIGDSERDIVAASRAGVKNTILVRSGHTVDETNSKARFILDSIKFSKDIILE